MEKSSHLWTTSFDKCLTILLTAQDAPLFGSTCNHVVSLPQIPGGHNLFVQDKEVAGIIENVFRKFKLMLMKKDDASKANLLTNLKRINSHLEARPGSRFLTGDTMCCFDCELMPKLQHIRVAGETLQTQLSDLSDIRVYTKCFFLF